MSIEINFGIDYLLNWKPHSLAKMVGRYALCWTTVRSAVEDKQGVACFLFLLKKQNINVKKKGGNCQ